MTHSQNLPPMAEIKKFSRAAKLLRTKRKEAGFETAQSFCDSYMKMFDENIRAASFLQYEQGTIRPSQRRFERFCTILNLDKKLVNKLEGLWGGNFREVKIHDSHIFSQKEEDTLDSTKESSSTQKPKLVSFDSNKFPELVRYMEAVLQKEKWSTDPLSAQDKTLIFVLSV